MTRRKVIFPPADYWTNPPKKEEPPMPTSRPSTPEENEAALAFLAVIDAAFRGDQQAVNIVLDPWVNNAGPVLQFATAMMTSLIASSVDRPDLFISNLRHQLIDGMASQ